MGYDQRDVPLNIYLIVAAFLLLVIPSKARNESPIRCGFHSQGILADRARPTLPEFVDDAEGLFRVHFTREGIDAVPSADLNLNNIPDYVEYALEALNRSWKLYTDTLSAGPVPRDGANGGSSAIDVYLLDLSKIGYGLYGETVPETKISSPHFPKYTSWMQLDNDFAETDRNVFDQQVFATYGIEGLQITCAHELHHVIQIGVYGDAAVQLSIYEMTSTWMEQRCYPDIRDWAVYAANLFEQPTLWPFSDPRSGNGYVWGWFPNVYRKRVGDDLISALWSKIGSGARPFNALVDAGYDLGYPLDSAFIDLLPYLYHTGSRGDENPILPGADSLPEIKLAVDDVAQEPSTIHSGALRPFEVRAVRYQVPAASGGSSINTGIVFTWADPNAFVQTDVPGSQNYTITLTPTPTTTDVLIKGSTWGVRVQGANVVAYVEGAAYDATPAPYPQPLVLSTTTQVRIPVNSGVSGDDVTVEMMTVQGLGLAKQTSVLMFDDVRLVATLDVPSDITPGTYLVSVQTNGERTMHKIMVKR